MVAQHNIISYVHNTHSTYKFDIIMTLSLWRFDYYSGSVPIQWSPVPSSVVLSATAVVVCHYCRPQQTPLGLGDVSSASPVVSPVEYSATSNSPQISREGI